MKTISLCMIVKNESHVIERCLDSVKGLIDYVFIMISRKLFEKVERGCNPQL